MNDMNNFRNIVKNIVITENAEEFVDLRVINDCIGVCKVQKREITRAVKNETIVTLADYRSRLEKTTDAKILKYIKDTTARSNGKLVKFYEASKLKFKKKTNKLLNASSIRYIDRNLLVSIWTSKMILIKINSINNNNTFLPCKIMEHILQYSSSSFVWSLFFGKIDDKAVKRIMIWFKRQSITNIGKSGYTPNQFVSFL
jgi:hypothetical protein